MAKSPKTPPQVTNYTHDDRRVMNPEVGLVKPDNDPEQEKTTWAYDPHLDPALQFDSGRAQIETLIDDALASGDQDKMRDALEELKRMQSPYLNWAGKAERTSFEIDTVSLHVHERIDPATILEGVKKKMHQAGFAEEQLDFFHQPFEDKPLREALGFYQHDKDWSNRLVTGDSLLVMNSLLQKESMRGQVQMIYIDPPYGIKYGSNFQPFTNKKPNTSTDKEEDLTQEPEMVKAFRDTWELGIHSYLTYLRDRLILARELLNEKGSVFVQISDENLHHVRELMDEVFGAENFLSVITYVTTSGIPGKSLSRTGDFIVWYGKSKPDTKYNQLYKPKGIGDDGAGEYKWLRLANGTTRSMSEEELSGNAKLPEGARAFRYGPVTSSGAPSEPTPFELNGRTFNPSSNNHWKTTLAGLERVKKSGLMIERKNSFSYFLFLDFYPVQPVANIWLDTKWGFDASEKTYVVQTNEKIIERCILMATDPGDLVLDPTCGSGTTAVVAEKWGRRWITCDTSRVAVALTKQRLMTSSFDFFRVRYPHEGLKGGFEYSTVPHVTLSSIAHNPDIETIYEEEHSKIELALDELNAALLVAPPNALKSTLGVRKAQKIRFRDGETLHEWEVPFDWPEDWPEGARKAFDAFHAARRSMQARMDQTIADQAEQETLFDQPKKDPSRLRVTGKFTVEAVPAPVVMGLDDDAPPTGEPDDSLARSGATSRQSMWRDELLKTGIRGKNKQMMEFADLEVIPGLKNLHASGSLAESGDRVVVNRDAAVAARFAAIRCESKIRSDRTHSLRTFPTFDFRPSLTQHLLASAAEASLRRSQFRRSSHWPRSARRANFRQMRDDPPDQQPERTVTQVICSALKAVKLQTVGNSGI